MSWLMLWPVVFYAAVGSFALVSVLVTVGGFREVRELFRAFAERGQKPRDPR